MTLAAGAGECKPGGGSRWPAAATLTLALALAVSAWPASSTAAERQFPTFVALGFAQPIETAEGRYTPIVVADHESQGWYGGGRLNASIYTSTWSAGMTHPAAARLDLGYSARLRVTTEGDSSDIYRDGDRDSASEFIGNSLAAIGSAAAFPGEPWRVKLELERMQAWFSAHENTRSGYRLPENFAQNEARVTLSRHGLLGEEAAEVSYTGAHGSRDGWEGWALDPDADVSREYTLAMLHGAQPFSWENGSESKLEAWWLAGSGLDLFSGYAVGGLTGRYAVGGYYRNEFRAQRAAIVNALHEHRFSQHRRLTLFAQGARLRTLDGAAYGDGAWETLASGGLGFYYGIRSLNGLPVIVRYAEGLLIPDGSKEGHRREIVLLVAAGF